MSAILRRDFTVHIATTGEEALEIASSTPISVALVDQRIPGTPGTQILASLARSQPDCIRILVTAYGDSAVLRQAINEAHIYRFIAKPIDPDQLRLDLRRAVEHQQATTALTRARAAALDRRCKKRVVTPFLRRALQAAEPDDGRTPVGRDTAPGAVFAALICVLASDSTAPLPSGRRARVGATSRGSRKATSGKDDVRRRRRGLRTPRVR